MVISETAVFTKTVIKSAESDGFLKFQMFWHRETCGQLRSSIEMAERTRVPHSNPKHAFPLLPPRLYLVLHSDFSENSKNNESSSGNMNIYRNTEDKFLKHRCNICEKQILTKEKIKQHQDEVHKNKGLKCTECNHRVKSRSSLSRPHRSSSWRGEVPLQAMWP